MHGLILAAGEGSRLAAAGMAIPKPIVEVAGKPQIVRLLETLDALGCASLTCAVRADVPAVRPLLDDALLRAPLTVIACRTPSSLHTLVEGLAVAPAGPVLCSMVDAVMRAEQWRRVYREVEAGLAAGADAVLVVTPYVDDESPVYVGRSADGAVSAVADSPIEPPCVTGGVYGLDPGARRAAAEAVAAGVQRMRGFLKAFVAAGRRVSARPRARRAGDGLERARCRSRVRLRGRRGRGSRAQGALLRAGGRPAGQARLLLALLAPGAGRAALDRAALLVPRNGRAAGVLRGPRGDGLQRAVREDAVLPLLDPRHARLAHRHPGPGEGGRGVRGAARVERRDLLEPHPCMSSPRGSGERWTA